MQSKKDTHKEVLLNNVLGVLVGLIAIRVMIPLLEGINADIQSIIIVGVMFCLSYVRGYMIRRFFNKRITPQFDESKKVVS
jgi:O-antigen/teichoic acid export membrane protein